MKYYYERNEIINCRIYKNTLSIIWSNNISSLVLLRIKRVGNPKQILAQYFL